MYIYAGDDLRRLENGVHVVSGTPGRVFDMIKRRSLRTRQIKVLVLDEADEMLGKGFKEQIYDVYRYLPPDTQVGAPPFRRGICVSPFPPFTAAKCPEKGLQGADYDVYCYLPPDMHVGLSPFRRGEYLRKAGLR